MARALFPFAVTLAALSFSARAGAYCRTTTVAIPDDYDPTTQGCITTGTPIAWPSMPVTYELNEAASAQVSLADATTVFEAAFASWVEVSCGAAGATAHPALSFEIQPSTTHAYTHCGADAQACEMAESQGPHQIVFRDDAWPYDDMANTIALTTVTFGLDSGHILSSNMEINSHDFQLSIADPPPAGKIALPAIARHEGGHFVGLAHSQDTTAAMYAYYSADMMTLTPDDEVGICAVYPPASASGCSCSASGGAGGALGLGVAGVALAAVVGRRRRRRAR